MPKSITFFSRGKTPIYVNYVIAHNNVGRPLQDDVISISHSVYWEKHPNSERGAHVRPLQCHYPLTRLLFKDVLGQAHGFIAEEAFVHGLQIFGDVRYEFHLVEDVLLQIHARCDFRED